RRELAFAVRTEVTAANEVIKGGGVCHRHALMERAGVEKTRRIGKGAHEPAGGHAGDLAIGQPLGDLILDAFKTVVTNMRWWGDWKPVRQSLLGPVDNEAPPVFARIDDRLKERPVDGGAF